MFKYIVIWYVSSYVTGITICWYLSLTGYASIITAQPNYYYTTYDPSAINFVCNNSSYSLSDCNFTTTYDSVCQSHQYDAYLTCTIGMSYTWY